ncbi:bifunctional nitrate reductase/sulfite reductase flavoprotein subunit alpha [Pseudomonas sp. UBA4194]|uniref:bifunctional nitrate reductase/sulfite reductase flavoprotein subunit alpha n=1 Tax=Pseudomonas sp. UBA4194 TaxID=1947317 RepID=UPI0025FD945E|nr:bifunctional nitrate reductase/sulfite reductase flavoprotein subunit alpha [Pseudomonas sp. UBA4194]
MNSISVRSVCPYCGVGCGIVMTVQNNRVTKVSGDKSHPSNFGRLCTKGSTCAQPLSDAGRMQHAYLREHREHEPVQSAMDTAIAEAGTRLRQILDQHGPDALAFYVSGQMSLEAQYLANKLAKGYVRTRHIESNSRLCMASAGSGYKLSLGADGPPGSYQDFDHADVFFVIGANMADCHPILFLRLLDRLKAGARLIVVDPRRNATADKANLFLQIKPGTDLALINGLLHLLHANGHTHSAFIEAHTEDWEALPAFLADYTPAKVAAITGLDEQAIRQAAEWIGTAPNWMSCWTMGLNQSTHGTWNTNALCNLHLATGAICRPGSGPFSLTGQPNAMGGREMGYMGPGLPGQRSLLNEADRAHTEALWNIPKGSLREEGNAGTLDLFQQMRKGAIKACWIICTNPVASVANRQQVIEGLQAAELVIAQDAFLDTETNRYADLLLPAALWAEGEGVMINSERNLTLMPKAVDAPGQALPDWQIIARVACEMGFAEGFGYTSAEQVYEELQRFHNPQTGYDLRGASYSQLRQQPLQWPCAPDQDEARHPIRYLSADGVRFPTASGKARFFARPHMPPAELPDDDYPLVLNTGRLQHQWHTLTKTGKVPTLNKLNPGPFIQIHPLDAERLGIGEADQVQISSRRGKAVLPAQISSNVRPGDCFAPFHWNDVYGEHWAINAVTSDAIDPISQQPEFKFTAVALQRVGSPKIAVLDLDQTPAIDMPKDTAPMPTSALARLLGLDEHLELALLADEQLYLQGYLLGLRSAQALDGVPCLPSSAPLAPAKRLMVDGLLAGLYARTATLPQPSPPPGKPGVLVLWASQTGNAQALAERCAQGLRDRGESVLLRGMDEVSLAELSGASRAVLVTSTFGDGDAPDNASGLWAALQSDQAQAQVCAQLRYAVLALGDSSYDQFCGFGRKLDERLHSLGGQRLLARIECEPDDQEPAQQWLQALNLALGNAPAPVESPAAEAPLYSKKRPWLAKVLHNQVLNAEGAEKEIRQVVFDLKDSGLTYEAGDALGVWPSNCMSLVEELLASLGLDSSQRVFLKDHGEQPLAVALHKHLDITRITPDWLALIAQRSGDPLLNHLLEPCQAHELKDWLWGRQLIDLLEAFPLQLHVEELLGLLKPLQPRLYSISSSARSHPHEVHITVSTVRYHCGERVRSGLCSGFLADRSAPVLVPIFVQKSAHFRVPGRSELPMIMVGPGTGVAPFRAFVQERQALGHEGANWLLFGEQRAAHDFYYQDEWQGWLRSGHLHRLDTAFSRDQQAKVYVQDRLREQGAEVWRWLQQGSHFYVCGDASRMARDVDAALKEVVAEHGGMSRQEAEAYVAQMGRDKRYVRDVY